MKGLLRFWSIALTEWKLQIRTAIFGACLAILLLYALGQVIGAPKEMMFLTRQWLGTRDDSLTWLSIGLIFLVPSALARDRRTTAFVWTTPVTSHVYAGGKLMGVYLTSLTLAAGELVGQIVVRAPNWDGLTPENLDMILRSLAGWSVGIFYVSSVYFLLTTLVKDQALSAYALSSVYFVATFSIRDVANPLGAFPFPVFRSDLVGDGPESALFGAHHVLYLTFTIMLSLLSLWVYAWRERCGVFPKVAQLGLALGLAFSLGAASWAGYGFILARTKILPLLIWGTDTVSMLAEDDVDTIQVTAHFLPEQGKVSGKVQLDLSRPVTDLAFYIPTGLDLIAITDCQGQNISATYSDLQWARFDALSQVCVEFEGALYSGRPRYQRMGYVDPENLKTNAGAYVGQGYLYLLPTFRWYPAPIGAYEWRASHTIEITLPGKHQVFTSPFATAKPDGEWRTYRWQNLQGNPFITIAVGDYREVDLSGGDTVWVAPEHEYVARQTASFYLEFLRSVEQLTGAEHLQHTVIETPVLRWSIVSQNFTLLPERYFTERLSSKTATEYEMRASISGPEQAFLQEAYYVVRGWMQGQTFFYASAFLPYQADNTSAPAFKTDLAGYIPLQECLAHYLAMQLMDRKFGTDRLSEEIDERARYADRYLKATSTQENKL
jgi:hypothetical protein